jgi:hypothetical protein
MKLTKLAAEKGTRVCYVLCGPPFVCILICIQTGLYEGDAELREGHLLMEGGVLSMTSDGACVRLRLEALFTSVDHCSARERRGCALAFGFICHRCVVCA